MRKLKPQVQMSINGFIASPKGEMDWVTFDWDDELEAMAFAYGIVLLRYNKAN